MLVIRDAQLAAMADLGLEAFADSVRAFLGRKYPGALGPEEASRLVAIGISTCLAHGFDQQGAIIEFSEAMLTNGQGLRSAGDMESAAQIALREFKARKVLARLMAMRSDEKGADPQPNPAESDPASSAEETGT